jgi:hypothetical protein
MEGNTTLAEIKARYPFNDTVLANLAEVNAIVIHWMLTSQPVTRWQAEEVLSVLSLLLEEDYSLDTVAVVLSDEMVRENE